MEDVPGSNHEAARALFMRKAHACIHAVRTYFTTLDLNLAEGQARASIAPSRFIHVPDYPPMPDDTAL
jgi:hypothetical protein